MRKLLVNLDNTLDEFLTGEANQAETVRKALYVYKGNIETDWNDKIPMILERLGKRLDKLDFEYKETQARLVELYELVEQAHETIREVSNR